MQSLGVFIGQVAPAQLFATAGTHSFTPGPGVNLVYLTMQGAGASGSAQAVANGASGNATGEGGEGGQLVVREPYRVVPGNSYTVIVGEGGAGVVATATFGSVPAHQVDGNNGGSTSFDGTLVCAGGRGGGVSSGAEGATGPGTNGITDGDDMPALNSHGANSFTVARQVGGTTEVDTDCEANGGGAGWFGPGGNADANDDTGASVTATSQNIADGTGAGSGGAAAKNRSTTAGHTAIATSEKGSDGFCLVEWG